MAETRLHKGNLVRFQLGMRTVEGQIKEDRGPIGIKGRHLYLVEFCSDPQVGSLSRVELPADQLELVQDKVSME